MTSDAHDGPQNAAGADESDQDQHGDAEEQLSLDQLDAQITQAEQLHSDLSARLDSIARD